VACYEVDSTGSSCGGEGCMRIPATLPSCSARTTNSRGWSRGPQQCGLRQKKIFGIPIPGVMEACGREFGHVPC
jgi:hypothetical protein